MSQDSDASAVAALSSMGVGDALPMRTASELAAAAAQLVADLDSHYNSSIPAASGNDAGVVEGSGVDADSADVLMYDETENGAAAEGESIGGAAMMGATLPAAENVEGSGNAAGSGDQGLIDRMESEEQAMHGAAGGAAIGGGSSAGGGGDATGDANGESTGSSLAPPPASRQLTLVTLSEEEEDEVDDDDDEGELSDYEYDELLKKKQQELEKMLVDIKAQMVLAETKLNYTGKKVLKEMLKDKSITKEQQTKINTLFVKTKELSNDELFCLKLVVDAEIASKQVPIELDSLQKNERRIERALDEKVKESLLQKRQKLDRRVQNKVAMKSPVAKRGRK